MKKSTHTRTKIGALATTLAADRLLLVAGGQDNKCVTASGADCVGDDCGVIHVGDHCGP
jgi:hypothetical protein